MHNIILLTRLQIVQMIGGFKSSLENRVGLSGKATTIGSVILYTLLLAGTVWLGHTAYGMLGLIGMSHSFYDMLFLAAGMFTFVFSLPAVLGSFFGSSDINDLLPLPVSELSIAFSKAIGALAASYTWTLVLLAGPLLGWGIAAGSGPLYWVTYVFSIVCAPMMPVAYSGILSIVIAKLFKRARNKDTITTITTVLTMAITLAAYFGYRAVESSGFASTLSALSDVMGGAVMAFPAYGFAVYALQYSDPLSIVLFVLISLATFAVFVFVARMLYLRIVTTLSASGGRATTKSDVSTAKTSSIFTSMVFTELRKVARTSTVLLTYVVYPIIITPVILVFLGNSDSLREPLSTLAETGVADIVAAGIILCVISFFVAIDTASNKIASTAVSREGSNWIHMKFIPVPLTVQLRAKAFAGWLVNAAITLVITVVAYVVIVSAAGISPILIVWNTLLLFGACWLIACVGVMTDARSPRVNWGCDGDATAKNVGGNAGMLRGMVIGIVYALLPLLVSPLVKLNPFVFMPVIAIAGVAIAFVLGELSLRVAARGLQEFE